MRSASVILNCAVLAAAIVLASCSSSQPATAPFIQYGSFPRPIPLPVPTAQLTERFNASVPGVRDSLVKNDTTVIRGFTTRNREFLAEVITPLLRPYLDSLRGKEPVEIINALAIFGHELFRQYLGKEFYRWGGDINDLDDPQEKGSRIAFAYGLDCSGFVCLPYELAVRFGLLDSLSDGALFSSKGFARYCMLNHFPDRSGRGGTGNRFRPDTDDLHRIGREIFSVARGAAPSSEQMRMAQPGDIVIRNGHVGMLVKINNDMYYLESGGRVVPRVGWYPCHASEAIEIFAKTGALSIRRALPDLHPTE